MSHAMLLAAHDTRTGKPVACAARNTVCGGCSTPAGYRRSTAVPVLPGTGRGSTT